MKAYALLLLLAAAAKVDASVFLPRTPVSVPHGRPSTAWSTSGRKNLSRTTNYQYPLALAIPGNGVAEQVFVGGFGNFLSIYNLLITGRILLSWFPAAQGIGALQPLYSITDPFLNVFRGIVPPVFGLDLSPILGFFLLNVLTNATVAVGCELQPSQQGKYPSAFALRRSSFCNRWSKRRQSPATVSLNL